MGQKMFDIMKLRNCFSVSSRDKRFFFSSKESRPTLRPTQPSVQLVFWGWEGWGPPEVHWREHEAYTSISSPSVAQIKHEQSVPL